jgi:hypothetical protein
MQYGLPMQLSAFSIVLVLAGATTVGCATADDQLEGDQTAAVGATTNLTAFVLTVESGENPITVSSPGVADNVCPAFESRNFAYVSGSQLTIKTFPTNLADCEQFIRWDGACAGQGHQCSLVINSNLSTTSVFGPILGCVPK